MQRVVLSEYDENGNSSLGTSVIKANEITASDTTILPPTKALYIGGTGDIAVVMNDGSSVTLKAVPVGMYYVSVTKVMATGTTATNIVALY